MDAEASNRQQQRWERHAAGCSDCRDWQERATRLRRRSALGTAASGNGAPALGPLASPRARRALTSHLTLGARLALAALAAGQAALALGPLLAGEHEGHELSSAALAVAVGSLLVALQPRRAKGVSGVVIPFAVFLAATTALDVLRGVIPLMPESAHLVVVAEALLVGAIARSARPVAPPTRPAPRRPLPADGGDQLRAVDNTGALPNTSAVDPPTADPRRRPA